MSKTPTPEELTAMQIIANMPAEFAEHLGPAEKAIRMLSQDILKELEA